MNNLHQKLTSKYQFYHNWYQNKHHNKVHWGGLLVFILLVFGTILYWTPISFAADTTVPSTPEVEVDKTRRIISIHTVLDGLSDK